MVTASSATDSLLLTFFFLLLNFLLDLSDEVNLSDLKFSQLWMISSLSPALNGRASVELGSLCFKQILKLLKLADEFSWNWFHEKKLKNKELNHHQICLPLDFSRNWGTSLCFTLYYSWVASSLDLKLRPPQHLDHCRRLTPEYHFIMSFPYFLVKLHYKYCNFELYKGSRSRVNTWPFLSIVVLTYPPQN